MGCGDGGAILTNRRQRDALENADLGKGNSDRTIRKDQKGVIRIPMDWTYTRKRGWKCKVAG